MKRTAIVFAIALCITSLYAQGPKTIEYAGGFRFEAPTQGVPAALTKIFSNLGPATSAFYFDAWLLTGPASSYGSSIFIAMPFTPKANAHVSQVRAAVQYAGSGANQGNLSLYSDVSGAPGTLLAGPVTVTNLPNFYACCKLEIANFAAVAVTAGVQYWIVADTPASGTGSDFYGVWAFVPPAKSFVGSNDRGAGWIASPAPIQEPAGSVFGTIP